MGEPHSIGRWDIVRKKLQDQYWRLHRYGGEPTGGPLEEIYEELRELNDVVHLIFDGVTVIDGKQQEREEAGGDG